MKQYQAGTQTLRAKSEMHWDGISLYIGAQSNDGKRRLSGSVVYEEVDDGYWTAPALELDKTRAQVLMDDLWACGLRPTEGAGSAGALAATQRHLDDMRKLVFEVQKWEREEVRLK